MCQNLLSVDQWGNIAWVNMANAFQGAKNLTILATDVPNLQNVKSLAGMFKDAVGLTGNFSGWDTSTITNMNALFAGASNFNQPLSSWDTSAVVDMAGMFSGASNFNQPLAMWNVANVTTMSGMFQNASSFNQALSGWDVSKVTTVVDMFNGASSFNQDISMWNLAGLLASSSANMLLNTALSVYNYNELLDKWSQQTTMTTKQTITVSPTKYGGCEENAQAGIEGKMRLLNKSWTITDGGVLLCEEFAPFITTWTLPSANYVLTLPTN
jgi:surface protein